MYNCFAYDRVTLGTDPSFCFRILGWGVEHNVAASRAGALVEYREGCVII